MDACCETKVEEIGVLRGKRKNVLIAVLVINAVLFFWRPLLVYWRIRTCCWPTHWTCSATHWFTDSAYTYFGVARHESEGCALKGRDYGCVWRRCSLGRNRQDDIAVGIRCAYPIAQCGTIPDRSSRSYVEIPKNPMMSCCISFSASRTANNVIRWSTYNALG